MVSERYRKSKTGAERQLPCSGTGAVKLAGETGQ